MLLALIGGLVACGQAPAERGVAAAQAFGLYTSLPIMWQESERVADLLSDKSEPHWLFAALRRQGRLVPLDSLVAGDDAVPLPGDAILILAQPRPFSPQENVALDEWVRGGGRVLLFADPMLTGHSIHSIGDPRRPQDVALLSPILSRWGLVLEFDDAQAAEERIVVVDGVDIPVNLAGRFRSSSPDCITQAEGLLARCGIGSGKVLALADAALLEDSDSLSAEGRESVFDSLVKQLSERRSR